MSRPFSDAASYERLGAGSWQLVRVEGRHMWPAFNDDSRVCEAQPQLTPRAETFTIVVSTVTSVSVEIVPGCVRA